MVPEGAGDGRTETSLRTGFTTGACAACAAGAAVTRILGGTVGETFAIAGVDGGVLRMPVRAWLSDDGSACASVRKDAGDDPDSTDGIEIIVTVRRRSDGEITVDGGAGVGRVTKPGLDQPVGNAAINRVPRQMIRAAVQTARDALGGTDGYDVIVSIPEGQALAARTFNPRLGIVGGLSILGTTGIVKPMSRRALLDSIAVEMRMHRAAGGDTLVLTPGKYGEAFLARYAPLSSVPSVVIGNYVGEALDRAVQAGFRRIVLVGHIGKIIKLSGGIMDTHSAVADGRLEFLALQAALAGAGPSDLVEILHSATVDQGLVTVQRLGLVEPVLAGIARRAEEYLRERADRAGDSPVRVGVIFFSNKDDLLTRGPEAENIVLEMQGTRVGD